MGSHAPAKPPFGNPVVLMLIGLLPPRGKLEWRRTAFGKSAAR
jgi:hypothetical protein